MSVPQGLLATSTVAPCGAGPVAVGVADVGGTDSAKKEGRELLEAADSIRQNDEEEVPCCMVGHRICVPNCLS